ncbi:Holliday junction resolvase RuvX, partial [Nocardia sp. NPDC058518]
MTTPGSSSEESADRPDPATDPGRGRRIAIDVGSVRIGVASSDPDGIEATPRDSVAGGHWRGGAGGGPPGLRRIVGSGGGY